MKCPECKKRIPNGSVECPKCGADTGKSKDDSNSADGLNFREFLKLSESKDHKESIASSSVLLCFCGLFIVLLAFLFPELGLKLSSAIIPVALGIWLIVSKSRTSAVVALVYALYLLSKAPNGINGWLLLVAGVCAVISVFRAKRAYKAAGGKKSK